MKAARWHGPQDIRVENIEEPKTHPGTVKVKVEWAGICGSDLHEYLGGPIFIPRDNPHPLTNETAPIVMGHEFSGKVVEVDPTVTSFQVGDRVCIEPIYACGKCFSCRRGHYNLCVHLGFHGLSGGGGGFSEFTVVPEYMVHKLPDNMTFEQGALVEPAAVALHAVRQSRLKAGDKVAVFGAGPIGLLVIQAAKLAGASQIFAVEISEQRQAFALSVGAAHVIDPSQTDAVQEIQQVTGGGVDIAFEVTGVPAVLTQAINSTALNGETVIVSIWEKPAEIHPNDLVLGERTVMGILAYRHIFPEVIQLIANKQFKAEELITKKISLDQIVKEGFEALVKQKSQVKIVVQPN
ncbi:2,3-butanediol dehydrogenase [Kyrpidia sp.]|uniref:2,3-butanediol dehydrogenase n=1 Tax=Kyrpidia sp. TaxID=2073077 RepID=UPI0017EDB5C6|nr:2,3-butanediol dehydrogenase [Kyrpidia sp.]MCL6577704.1 2,3-butanediol dehydrogenase [Kyrpidia sp.]HHY67697.1 2,3-butanediol dehydrogenase [Alicyclobacillus sp.]